MQKQALNQQESIEPPHYHKMPQDSFITEQQPNVALRALKKVDIFSFIPVPKDDSVSTKQSLIGTAVFFAIFLTYIIYDFVQFVVDNPPIQQSYLTPLDSAIYQLPNFAVAFMTGNNLDQTDTYNTLFNYSWLSLTKTQGGQSNFTLSSDIVSYQNNNPVNFGLLNWMSDATKKFYYVLRTPTQPLYAQGLLYSTDVSTYVRVKMSFCFNGTASDTCINNETMAYLSNFGRFFLFVQNTPDQSPISLQTPASNGNNYLLYNFFAVQGYYKRINVNFAVIKSQILPDYLNRWTTQTYTRLQVDNIFEQLSVVTYNNTNNTDAIAFNFQLSPQITNNRISFVTLLDRISKWGASWGVLFAVFAIFFLSYNRKKFYSKNPAWSKFKKMGSSFNADIEVQKKGQNYD